MKPRSIVAALTLCSVAAHGAPTAAPDSAGEASSGTDMRGSFMDPPMESRPAVWWRFMDDYASSEGVLADLDAMRDAGISGAVVSYCSSSWSDSKAQKGMPHIPILSPEWWKLTAFQNTEAAKRGLSLWFQACPGYATSGGPWIDPEHSMQKVVWTAVENPVAEGDSIRLPVPTVDQRWNFYRDIGVLAYPTPAAGQAVNPKEILDLSDRMDASGVLRWTPPPGKWKVVRFGHTTTGITVHPATPEGKGLECDKMSREATRIQFENYFGKILAQRPEGAGIHTQLFYDSWEAGTQNWTPRFREEFQKRRGYDPMPWLAVAVGDFVASEAESRRFDYDWKTTIEELINSEHFAELARLSHEAGCTQFRAQPYNGPVNFMTAGALFDIPEGEYWHGRKDYGWWTLRMIASVAHTSGKKIVSAESLTSTPSDLRFDASPFETKAETDLAFTMGINRMAMHVMPHNPWPNLKPGMNCGPYGPIFSRGQSWAPLAASWITYLARCCYVLEQGDFVADVVRLARPNSKEYPILPGFASDLCDRERIVTSMTWDQEALTLPGGMRYRLLELVNTTAPVGEPLSPSGIESRLNKKALPQTISLPLLRKVRDLVHAGATVVGPRPISAPGLEGFPESDQQIAEIATELWGPDPTATSVDRRVGHGRVITGKTIPDVLSSMGIAPDFQTVESLPPNDLPWIHRRVGADDFYFISNQQNKALTVTASFRVDGKVPEFWHPDSGATEPAAAWIRKEGRTLVTLALDPRGSLFVRFRPGSEPPPGLTPRPSPQPVATIPLADGWKVDFPAASGGPGLVTFDKLVSWTDRTEKEIHYFSGVATYDREFTAATEPLKPGQRALLDLGEVKNVARITLNGHRFPELWKPPFVCDVTGVLKPGPNHLQIEVANVWSNRLVGDEQEPADIEWGAPHNPSAERYAGRPLKLFPEWLIQNSPRPSKGRHTFTTWNYVKKETPLLPSGLLGAVTISVTDSTATAGN